MAVEAQRKVARCPWKDVKCSSKLREMMTKTLLSKEKIAKLQDPNVKQIVKDLKKPDRLQPS